MLTLVVLQIGGSCGPRRVLVDGQLCNLDYRLRSFDDFDIQFVHSSIWRARIWILDDEDCFDRRCEHYGKRHILSPRIELTCQVPRNHLWRRTKS